ncbi:GGDEF domain-containing protein [Aestuariibacter sp. AA17]|uniref:diguanylate cyclase n=1 Tax=Fluctibacter corallii TaxID=2984329 RepID=A0ABT3A952_9ALTE|nr:GGDEF domain-containing protein [Aestuariibacter sp. AA17]MCV2885210.1 GGDEF domain-containing protein [Aestuariibacter sp. AA17]
MPLKQFIYQRLTPLTLLIIAFIFTIYWQQPTLSDWLSPMEWLPYAALCIAGTVAISFGRTRLAFLSLLSLGIGIVASEALHFANMAAMYVFVSAAWLLWRPDKGISPINLVWSVTEIAIICILLRLSIDNLANTLTPYLSGLFDVLHSLNPSLLTHLSVFEYLLIACLLAAGLLRVALVPTHTHVVIWLTQCLLVVIMLDTQFYVIGMIALAISALYLFAILTDSFNMAFRDELTGIPSRRALMQYVPTLGRKYVVAMSDVDHFKKFNDTYGHDVGDQVLKLVASRLNAVTGGGKAFRYGGEEFTIIFPRRSIADVTPHLDVLRQTIADYDIVLRGKDRPDEAPKKRHSAADAPTRKTVNVTCSFGVAERTADLTDFHDIMKQADIALYEAKKAGRNCVKSTRDIKSK